MGAPTGRKEFGVTHPHVAAKKRQRGMNKQRKPYKPEAAPDADSPAGRIWRGTKHILRVRAEIDALRGDVASQVMETGHDKLLVVRRPGTEGTLTGLYNFTAEPQQIEAARIGLDHTAMPLDLLTGTLPDREADRIVIPPYGAVWLHEELW